MRDKWFRKEIADAGAERREIVRRDLENAQVKTVGGERGGVVGQVRMAGCEAAAANREVAAIGVEPAAAAKLLIDAQAAAGRVRNVGIAALDPVGRGAQFDQGGAVEFLQGEFTKEVRPLLRLEFGRDPE